MDASAIKFWDGIAEKYSKQKLSEPEAYEKKLAITQGYLTPDSKVFEFGCGTGTTALRHAPFAKQIIAIDVSEKMIDIANEKAKNSNTQNVDFVQTSFDNYEGQPGTFDMIMAHSILHLVPDRDEALRKSYELLKPGGKFVTSAPCVKSFFKPIIAVMKFFGKAPPVFHFTPEKLKSSIKAAGFEIIQNKTLNKDDSVMFIVAEKK